MDDFRIKTSFTRNPKREKLRRALGAEGVLALIDLWSYVAQEKTDGNLEGLDDDDIEIASQWSGQRGVLTETLSRLGFLDGESGSYRIHDWEASNPYVATHRARSKQAKRAINKRWEKHKQNKGVNTQMQNEYYSNAKRVIPNVELSNTPSPSPSPSPDPDLKNHLTGGSLDRSLLRSKKSEKKTRERTERAPCGAVAPGALTVPSDLWCESLDSEEVPL